MRLFWASVTAASISLSSALARAECTTDLDCKGDRICEAGRCAEPAPPAAPDPEPAAAPPPDEAKPPPAAAPTPPAAAPTPPAAAPPPDEAKPRRVRKRITRPGLLAAGIVMSTAGFATFFYGTVFSGCNGTGAGAAWSYDCHDSDVRRRTAVLISLGLIAVGVPMLVVGSKRERVPDVALAPWISRREGGLQLQLRL